MPKTNPKIGLPRFFLNFKVYLSEANVSKFVHLKSSGPCTITIIPVRRSEFKGRGRKRWVVKETKDKN